MSTVTHQPLQTLIDDLWQGERQQVEEQAASMGALEEAMGVLEDWGQRLEDQQAEQDAEQATYEKSQEAERLEAEEILKRLEHDLVTARERVADLQSSLQERTEELLKAQAANNELAAELQAKNDALPLRTPPVAEPAPEPIAKATVEEDSTDAPEPAKVKSVSDRFGRLRKKK